MRPRKQDPNPPDSASAPEEKEKLWQKTPVANLVRYIPSGKLFARLRVKGKLIRRSLKTKSISVAKLRLTDLEKAERQLVEHASAFNEGKMTFADAVEIFRKRFEADMSLKSRTKEHRGERISTILKTWAGLAKADVGKISKQDCLSWAASYSCSAVNFNKTVQTLRSILEIAVESGVRYDNPALAIKPMKVRRKALQLPNRQQFHDLVASVRTVNKRFSHDAANLIEFLAFGGFRIGEARMICWCDCDFQREEILVRGDPITGTKNWTVRHVPMISRMRIFLERLKKEHREETSSDPQLSSRVMCVSECNGSLAQGCKRLGIPKITHHDLRHLFATTCIESGVDIPTVSRWLGHKDGGALAMEVYGHLRNEHSQEMAKKVKF